MHVWRVWRDRCMCGGIGACVEGVDGIGACVEVWRG